MGATSKSPPTATVTVPVTASTTGAREAKAGASTVCPISTGPSPGKDMLACTSSPVSPRALPTPSSSPFLRDSSSTANGGVRMVLTRPPPTISDSMVPTSPRRSCWSALASRPGASCGGTATRRRAPGLSRPGPKGNDHVWYRATFQLELNDGTFYSGYWEMDIHFRKPVDKMPNPYVVKFWPETWDSKPHYWHFYEREEVEQSTYDKVE